VAAACNGPSVGVDLPGAMGPSCAVMPRTNPWLTGLLMSWTIGGSAALFAAIVAVDDAEAGHDSAVTGVNLTAFTLLGLTVLTFTAWLLVGALTWRPTESGPAGDRSHQAGPAISS
jgi:hypothetical protein